MATDLRRQWRAQIGYRGLTLLMFGLIWILIGIGVSAAPNPVQTSTLPHTMLPITLRVGIWTVSGVVGVFAAVASVRSVRWQVPAFGLMVVPTAERAISYGWAALSEWPPPHSFSNIDQLPWPRITTAAIYVVITVALLLFASWPEPSTPVEPPPSNDPILDADEGLR